MIPDFREFTDKLKEIYLSLQSNDEGEVGSYIPQLKKVDPSKFAVSVCTVDGQRFSLGDSEDYFAVQSNSKTVSYCLALEEHGQDLVHQYVGREPSGRGFNDLHLNKEGCPHNPMINAGAIMCSALIRQDLCAPDRFDYVLDFWEKLQGGKKPRFNNSMYLSERASADKNYAIAYFMRSQGKFPKDASLMETLEFYFQCCSIESTSESFVNYAVTLANGGVCPFTQTKLLSSETVKSNLSLMFTCGMYDFSGEFAFRVGLPAKSGISGAVMLVIPKVLGMVIWSPRLDSLGNSVRAIRFYEELVKSFNFHRFDCSSVTKRDPRSRSKRQVLTSDVIWAASQGDLIQLQHFVAMGVDLNAFDYDHRSPLHLAVVEGKEEVVDFLLEHGARPDSEDRWGNSPFAEAKKLGNSKILQALERFS